MTAQFAPVRLLNGRTHYADLDLAKGWIDVLPGYVSDARGTRAYSEGWNQQVFLTEEAWRLIGLAYRAMNVSPWADPEYRRLWVNAFGPNLMRSEDSLDSMSIPIQGPDSLGPGTEGANAWIMRKAALVVDLSRGDLQQLRWRRENATVAPVRIGLNQDGTIFTNCMDIHADGPCNMDGSFSMSGALATLSGRPTVSQCIDASGTPTKDNWYCCVWDSPPFGRTKIVAPLIYFWQLAGLIVQSLASRSPYSIIEAAYAFSNQPASNPGSTAEYLRYDPFGNLKPFFTKPQIVDGLPSYSVPEPYGWHRPVPLSVTLAPLAPAIAPYVPAVPATKSTKEPVAEPGKAPVPVPVPYFPPSQQSQQQPSSLWLALGTLAAAVGGGVWIWTSRKKRN